MKPLLRGLAFIEIGFLFVFTATSATAAPQARTVFGPETFIRQTAAPIAAERSFTIPSFISPPLVLDCGTATRPPGRTESRQPG